MSTDRFVGLYVKECALYNFIRARINRRNNLVPNGLIDPSWLDCYYPRNWINPEDPQLKIALARYGWDGAGMERFKYLPNIDSIRITAINSSGTYVEGECPNTTCHQHHEYQKKLRLARNATISARREQDNRSFLDPIMNWLGKRFLS
jgi:hypothetical protein